jgi:hypothetical protein
MDSQRYKAKMNEDDKRRINEALSDQQTITLLSSTGKAAKDKREAAREAKKQQAEKAKATEEARAKEEAENSEK